LCSLLPEGSFGYYHSVSRYLIGGSMFPVAVCASVSVSCHRSTPS
jgi:hypothetical protein